MLSSRTISSLKYFFSHIAPFNLPYRWNASEGKLVVVKTKIKVYFSSIFLCLQILYGVFSSFRLYQSYESSTMKQILLQLAFLCCHAGSTVSAISHLTNAPTIAWFMNQVLILENKFKGDADSETGVKRFDIYAYFIFLTNMSVQYTNVSVGIFFLMNKDQPNFLYSILPMNSTIRASPFTVGAFAVFEVLSIRATSTSTVACIYFISVYFVQVTECLNQIQNDMRNAIPEAKTVCKFQYGIFSTHRILTNVFNKIWKLLFVTTKEVNGFLLILALVASIRFYRVLDIMTYAVVPILAVAAFCTIVAVYYSAGKIWLYTTWIKEVWPQNSLENKMIQKAIAPFGIVIGGLYVMKQYTLLSFTGIILENLCTVLLIFE